MSKFLRSGFALCCVLVLSLPKDRLSPDPGLEAARLTEKVAKKRFSGVTVVLTKNRLARLPKKKKSKRSSRAVKARKKPASKSRSRNRPKKKRKVVTVIQAPKDDVTSILREQLAIQSARIAELESLQAQKPSARERPDSQTLSSSSTETSVVERPGRAVAASEDHVGEVSFQLTQQTARLAAPANLISGDLLAAVARFAAGHTEGQVAPIQLSSFLATMEEHTAEMRAQFTREVARIESATLQMQQSIAGAGEQLMPVLSRLETVASHVQEHTHAVTADIKEIIAVSLAQIDTDQDTSLEAAQQALGEAIKAAAVVAEAEAEYKGVSNAELVLERLKALRLNATFLENRARQMIQNVFISGYKAGHIAHLQDHKVMQAASF